MSTGSKASRFIVNSTTRSGSGEHAVAISLSLQEALSVAKEPATAQIMVWTIGSVAPAAIATLFMLVR